MRLGPLVMVAAGAMSAAAAPAPRAPRIPRAELEALQSAVEQAVTRVSRPMPMAGRSGRAFHLQGYGAVIVLAPRALPRALTTASSMEARAFAEMARGLEQHLRTVSDPEQRRHLELALAALRGGPPAFDRPLPMPAPAAGRAPSRRDVAALQQEAEQFRREAERAMQRAEREVRLQLRIPEPPDALPTPSAELLPMLAPPAPPRVAVPPVPAVPPAPAAPPVPPAFPSWFGEPEPRVAPDQLVKQVRAAIVDGLGAAGGALGHLRPDEFVVVEVDFVPRLSDRAPVRTVVARAKGRDLAAARGGRLSRAQLATRVEFDEY